MPNFAAIYLIISLSSLGMPLLNGFIGEFVILRGVFEVPRYGMIYSACAVIGIVLGAAYLLWLYQRVMFGPVTNPANEKLADLNLREFACLVPLVLAAFWIGIYPKPLLSYIEQPAKQIVERVNPHYYDALRRPAPVVTVPVAGVVQPGAGLPEPEPKVPPAPPAKTEGR